MHGTHSSLLDAFWPVSFLFRTVRCSKVLLLILSSTSSPLRKGLRGFLEPFFFYLSSSSLIEQACQSGLNWVLLIFHVPPGFDGLSFGFLFFSFNFQFFFQL